MRIEGASQFLSRIAAKSGNAARNIINPYVIRKESIDILDVSEAGRRLRLRPGETAKLSETRASTGGNPILQLMDKSLSNVEEILEKMRDLAKLATDPKFSIVDRLDMQIKMEELKEKLANATNSMSEKFAEMSGQDLKARRKESLAGESKESSPGADTRSLLQRARDRAINGEAWNVAEGWEVFQEITKFFVKTPEMEAGKWMNVEEGTWFELPENIDPETGMIFKIVEFVGSARYVMSDKERLDNNARTTLEQLEASGTIILMDAQSAVRGVERLEMQLDEMKQMLESFAKFCNENASRSFSVSANRMSEGEISLLLGQIAQEQEAERLRLEAEKNPPRVYSEGADVNEGANREKTGTRKNESDTFHTQLGIMEYANNGPRLTRPENPKGEMFARIENLFDKIADRFARAIQEDVGVMKISWTNFKN